MSLFYLICGTGDRNRFGNSNNFDEFSKLLSESPIFLLTYSETRLKSPHHEATLSFLDYPAEESHFT
jgi:hypothetical protein